MKKNARTIIFWSFVETGRSKTQTEDWYISFPIGALISFSEQDSCFQNDSGQS